VVLPFTLKMTGNVARMQARLQLDRTAFGVGQGQFRTGGMVATPVTVTVDLTARTR
jgi:polyisoprenoid-binding protein YceI